MTVKTKVFFGILVLAAAGLVAAERSYPEAQATVELAPHAGLPAARVLDSVSAPRECNRREGIDTACNFI
ncbi:MAG: hypothetical protein M3R58_12955 [Pseudomonadota bacterium]|nr:hypothetical protein [Pseudomonadota bacterium]